MELTGEERDLLLAALFELWITRSATSMTWPDKLRPVWLRRKKAPGFLVLGLLLPYSSGRRTHQMTPATTKNTPKATQRKRISVPARGVPPSLAVVVPPCTATSHTVTERSRAFTPSVSGLTSRSGLYSVKGTFDGDPDRDLIPIAKITSEQIEALVVKLGGDPDTALFGAYRHSLEDGPVPEYPADDTDEG